MEEEGIGLEGQPALCCRLQRGTARSTHAMPATHGLPPALHAHVPLGAVNKVHRTG